MRQDHTEQRGVWLYIYIYIVFDWSNLSWVISPVMSSFWTNKNSPRVFFSSIMLSLRTLTKRIAIFLPTHNISLPQEDIPYSLIPVVPLNGLPEISVVLQAARCRNPYGCDVCLDHLVGHPGKPVCSDRYSCPLG